MRNEKIAHKTAVVYCRTSTGGQKDAGTIEAQVAACKKLVASHGLKLVPYGPNRDGWVKDDGVSGSLLAGRQFAKLLDDLHRDRLKVDFLVVPSMSRLARHDKSTKDRDKLVQSAQDNAKILAVLNGAEVKIIDDTGTNDPASILTEIRQSLSGEEYRLIRKRTMDGKARVLGNGAWATGGRVPYGYKRVFRNGKDKKEGTTLAPHEVDGPRFHSVMEEYVKEGAAHASRYAMKQGWPSPRGSKTWYPSTIQQLLNNIRAYRGETTLSIDGQQFDVTYPPLIDAKTYAAIERRKKERTLKHRTTLLGTGYVDCGVCGGHVHGSRSSTREYFHITCRERCTRMREDVFSQRLWEAVVCRLIQIKRAETVATIGKDPIGKQVEAAKAKLAKVQEQLQAILDLYLEGAFDKATLQAKSAKLKDQKAALQAEVDRLSRERESAKTRKSNEETVHARVQKVLTRLREGQVPLEGKRRILADLLQGGRVILTRRMTKKETAISLTLPSFGSLKPVTVKLEADITGQMLGASREALEYLHDATDGTVLGLGPDGETKY